MATRKVTTDSKGCLASFYGILNADGNFWTVLAFDSPEKAGRHIADFWKADPVTRDRCLRDFKIVPVRIRLESLAESQSNG